MPMSDISRRHSCVQVEITMVSYSEQNMYANFCECRVALARLNLAAAGVYVPGICCNGLHVYYMLIGLRLYA